MKNWILGMLAVSAFALTLPATAQAMSPSEQEKWFSALDMDSSLFFQGGGATEFDFRSLTGESIADPERYYPRRGENRGRTWWRMNGWWVLLLAIGVPCIILGGTTTTTFGGGVVLY